ncbi:hypothetical protein T484DRAFT_1879550 [Baffinella frigidus]|nr:hypothetical protein T484DRAFT_1879550 [Cryptophyta sp. CCMP2293]
MQRRVFPLFLIVNQDYSILDCVFVEQLGVFFVGDVMCWKGHSVYDCTAEFRLFWLQQKLAEDAPQAGVVVPGSNPYAFVPLPWYVADAAGLESAYSSVAVPFTRDGLLFMHRESHYEVGLTPLALTWKDQQCSTYLSESYPGVDPAVQVACLHVSESGALSTVDEPPVVVATAPPEAMAGVKTNHLSLALFAVQNSLSLALFAVQVLTLPPSG